MHKFRYQLRADLKTTYLVSQYCIATELPICSSALLDSPSLITRNKRQHIPRRTSNHWHHIGISAQFRPSHVLRSKTNEIKKINKNWGKKRSWVRKKRINAFFLSSGLNEKDAMHVGLYVYARRKRRFNWYAVSCAATPPSPRFDFRSRIYQGEEV